MNKKTDSDLHSLLEEISPFLRKQTDAKMIVSARIADAMKEKGWKHKDLLKAMNRNNPSLVTKWLSGTHNFTLETLVELEAALGISLLYLHIPNENFNESSAAFPVQKSFSNANSDFKEKSMVNTSKKKKPSFRSSFRKKIKS